MTNQLLARVKACPNLPSMPAIAVQVLELTRDNDVQIAKIAGLVSRDPAMAAKILKTVNSSFYGRSQRVGTISQAVIVLGLQAVKTLVLGFSLVSNLSASKAKGFDHRGYWKRSIYAATAARVLATKAGIAQQEEAFLAALLADIGMLVLDLTVGEQYGPVNAQAVSHEDLSAVEEATLGGTHAEVGGFIAEKWKLPAQLSGPIAYHHRPSGIADPAVRRMAQVIGLSGRVADLFVDADPAPALADVRRLMADVCAMPEAAEVDALLSDVGRRATEAAGLFELNVITEPDYETILERADEARTELTLQSQQQATQLAVKNEQLQLQATTDGLTGLSNRACFDSVLAERFADARASGTSLSLLMVDVDKFKSINDMHGHPSGDIVLQQIARLFKAAGRPRDLAARYGGEEMCLILPATPKTVASAVAEALRTAVAARPIPTAPRPTPTGVAPTAPVSSAAVTELHVTVSVGVATFEPGCPFREPGHLLKAADLAVYAAKRSGRNCVRVFTLPAPAAVAKVA
jgi:diguanylate cyclase (GGDEF)-like protein